jgi:hypothetical protein
VTTAPGRAALRSALLDPLAPPPSDPLAWIRDLMRRPEAESAPAPPAGVVDRRSAAPGSGTASAGPRETPPEAPRQRLRAEGVRELATHPVFREELQLLGREEGAGEDPAGLAGLLEWAGGPGWGSDRRWAVPTARLLAAANIGSLGAWLLGWLAAPLWVVGVLAALALHRRVVPAAERAFSAGEAAEGSVARWRALLGASAELPGETALPAELRAAIGDGVPAAPALRALERITDWAAVRRSALTHFPLVALTAWDVHHLERLERWRERHGARVGGWVLALGEVELLSALATLRFDHPDWVFARDGVPGRDGIRAEGLRHPLLAPAGAVANDVEVPSPGKLLLVTGSNMSGKSTLLRALGANQVLFLMGAPVAADAMRSPPVLPWTSMRVQDSLSQGVSFFLAELRRIRDVVQAARRGPALVLLDEILQGTNTAERRIAARTIVRHLLSAGALGAVTTHDLTLARADDLAPHLVEVHLREEVREVDGERTLSFDHRLRPGPATSRNALLLLDMVGLGPDEDGG